MSRTYTHRALVLVALLGILLLTDAAKAKKTAPPPAPVVDEDTEDVTVEDADDEVATPPAAKKATTPEPTQKKDKVKSSGKPLEDQMAQAATTQFRAIAEMVSLSTSLETKKPECAALLQHVVVSVSSFFDSSWETHIKESKEAILAHVESHNECKEDGKQILRILSGLANIIMQSSGELIKLNERHAKANSKDAL